MQKALQLATLFTVAAFSVAAHAQYGYPAGPGPYNGQDNGTYNGQNNGPRNQSRTQVRTFDSQPGPGVFVRSDSSNGVQPLTGSVGLTEVRISQGRADITVHHPAEHTEILVDLPGGQVSLLKDGLYTFNAATNTVRVLRGEASVLESAGSSKYTKVKEDQQLAFYPNVKLRAVDAYPYELTSDLLPMGQSTHGDGPYAQGFDGAYETGGYGYGYPYGYGYSPFGYGYGYPYGLGIGFGYYGGFGRGFGGGYGRGFGGYGGGFRR